MKLKIKVRSRSTFCPIKCCKCQKEIKMGDRYSARASGYERHEKC